MITVIEGQLIIDEKVVRCLTDEEFEQLRAICKAVTERIRQQENLSKLMISNTL